MTTHHSARAYLLTGASAPVVQDQRLVIRGVGVDVSWFDLAQARSDVRLGKALSVLDPGERARLGQFRNSSLVHHFAVGRWILKGVIGAYMGLSPSQVHLTREPCPACGGPNGRPSAVGGAGLHFSLTHTMDLMGVAIASVPVGVDLEPAHRRMPEGVVSLLHPVEQVQLRGRPETAVRCWVRKEAVLKALGLGVAHGVVEPLVGAGRSPLRGAGWELRDLAGPADHRAALAVLVD